MADRIDQDQTASRDQSDPDLHCLFRFSVHYLVSDRYSISDSICPHFYDNIFYHPFVNFMFLFLNGVKLSSFIPH